MHRIFSRVERIAKANIHHSIDLLEEPERVLAQYLRDMDDDIYEARREATRAIGAERKLETEVTALQTRLQRLHERARQALERGEREMARDCLSLRQRELETLDELQTGLDIAKESTRAVRRELNALACRRRRLQLRQSALVARYRAAHAGARIASHRERVHLEAPDALVDRMETTITDLQARANASLVLDDEDLELRLERTERESAVEVELETLEKEIGTRDQEPGDTTPASAPNVTPPSRRTGDE